MVENIEETIAELHIELEAMTDDQITAEYVKKFGEPEPVGRYEIIDRLLSKLQQVLAVSDWARSSLIQYRRGCVGLWASFTA